ncbi:uncharacterized protein BXZ73DRAFT_100919 [Epithele typhae]|uniref:uncharacterized protein n=1 Tax=Epithele typhae TaxID=378194 RepID=UPI002007F1C2|nr:uncharacterized protein BXZ73DRAFT_100919 [Epithele typhae]KAH9934081.1 hypothetical protein BXZ73DRAFT_100919 [Epithele typhae]
MAETLRAQHPPAMKVGGRRLSVTSRPKPAPPVEAQRTEPAPADTPPDYPRPAPPSDVADEQQHHQQHHQDDHEEVPKRKHGTGGDEHERRLQENLYCRAEQNRPRHEFQSGQRGATGGARIGQPAGKTLGA